MNRCHERARSLRFAVIASLLTCFGVACGGSATTSGDHNVGAGTSGGASGAGASGGASGAGARAGGGGTGGKTVELQPGSWQMTGIVTEQEPNLGIMPCKSTTFTLNVARDGAGYTATIGQDGFSDGPTVQITNGSYVLGGFYLPCGNQVTVSGLTLQGSDTDGDGKADALAGTVTGMAFSGGGDVVGTEPVQIAFSGVPDVTAPALVPPTGAVSPLLGFTVSASEPLAAAATVTLVGPPDVPLTAALAHSSVQSTPLNSVINWTSAVILPLSGKWQMQGTGQDLIGHPLPPGGTLTTLSDPGVFPQDGFENSLVVAIESGKPAIVAGFGTVKAISGTHSLWLAPGDAVTFHLRRAAQEKSLRFAVRAFGKYGPPNVVADIRAGVVGGQQVSMPGFMPSATSTDTGDATWSMASEVLQFSVPLTDAGADVLLRLAPSTCYGFCEPPSALLIDDLTLE